MPTPPHPAATHDRESTKAPKRAPSTGVVQRIAVYWLLTVFAFVAGVWTRHVGGWPYSMVKELEAFVTGHVDEGTTLDQKARNDLGLSPERFIYEDAAGFTAPSHYREVEGLPIRSRRLPPRIFVSKHAAEGFRFIWGTFDFKETLHGAILLAPDGSLKRVWQLTQEDVDWPHKADHLVSPHGVVMLPDGSFIVAFDGGTHLTRHSYCGERLWATEGQFNHSVATDEAGFVWTWGGKDPKGHGEWLVKVDIATGKVVQAFDIREVIAANPDVDVLNIRQSDSEGDSKYRDDPWHPNDIEPLPARLASEYEAFDVGDLLLSFRSIDLVCVIAPETKRIKWWRQGLVRRQHDPDWGADGTITIFDNNMHRGFSRIVEINPDTFAHRTVLEGSKYAFYTRMRGSHQRLADGTLMVTSCLQGRVFEVDPHGEVTFEFLNPYDPKRWMHVATALFLPVDYFDKLPTCSD